MVRPMDSKAEEQILEAAYTVILRRGKAGARMQEIADEAGVNKALLHYYFRSKDKIYTAILGKVIREVLGTLLRKIDFNTPIEEFVRGFVSGHINAIKQNQRMFQFFLAEIWLNPEEVIPTFREVISDSRGNLLELFNNRIQLAIEEKEIRPVDPRHLLINVLSLDVFYFLGTPIFTAVMEMNEAQVKEMSEERAARVVDFVWESIRYREGAISANGGEPA